MLTHVHKVGYTWWLAHLSKGKEDRVEKELVALVTE